MTIKQTYTVQELDEAGTPVFIDKKDDVWYALYYDEDTDKVIVRYQERRIPIKYRYNIDRIVQNTYKDSVARKVLSRAINNYKEHEVYREEPYKGRKIVTIKNADIDMTDISNNMKKLPKELRSIIFQVSENGHKLTIHSMVTQHDVEKHKLNTKAINAKLERRLSAAYEDKLDQRITAEQYDELSKRYKAEIEGLDSKIAHANSDDYASFVLDSEYLLKLSDFAPVLFKSSNPTLKNKLLKILLSNLEIKENHLSYKRWQPFDALASCLESQNWLPTPVTDLAVRYSLPA